MSNILIPAIEATIPMIAGVFVTVIGFSNKFQGTRWKMLKRFKYLGPAMIVYAAFLFANAIGASSPVDLAQVAAQINKRVNVPVMIDSETRFEGVQAVGSKELAFSFTLVNQASDSKNLTTLSEEIRKMVKNTSCQNRDWLTYLRAGVAITSRYLTSDGKEAVAITIRPSDCGL